MQCHSKKIAQNSLKFSGKGLKIGRNFKILIAKDSLNLEANSYFVEKFTFLNFALKDRWKSLR